MSGLSLPDIQGFWNKARGFGAILSQVFSFQDNISLTEFLGCRIET
jgi:hypothetical protein